MLADYKTLFLVNGCSNCFKAVYGCNGLIRVEGRFARPFAVGYILNGFGKLFLEFRLFRLYFILCSLILGGKVLKPLRKFGIYIFNSFAYGFFIGNRIFKYLLYRKIYIVGMGGVRSFYYFYSVREFGGADFLIFHGLFLSVRINTGNIKRR